MVSEDQYDVTQLADENNLHNNSREMNSGNRQRRRERLRYDGDVVQGFLDLTRREHGLKPNENFRVVNISNDPSLAEAERGSMRPLSLNTAQQLGVLLSRGVLPLLAAIVMIRMFLRVVARIYKAVVIASAARRCQSSWHVKSSKVNVLCRI